MRRLNKLRKTNKFKNTVYKSTRTALIIFAILQLALFYKPLPDFRKYGKEVDQG